MKAILIDGSDNVATALDTIPAGTSVTLPGPSSAIVVVTKDAIPYGHKFALSDIAADQEVRKYGASIGNALTAIAKGEHVHVHNIAGGRLRGDSKAGA